jgi:8-oxo-dGTP diphosphatase
MNQTDYDIYKSGAILLKNKKLLVTRSKGKDVFVAPGGKLEAGESPVEALVRELDEELQIGIKEEDLEDFGSFYAIAAGSDNRKLRMDVFIVNKWSGELLPNNEIEEMIWIDSTANSDIQIGSIFEHEVIPKLKELGLID